MQILIHKKPNKLGNYLYQMNQGKSIECGCFKTYEDGILYAEQEGYTKKIHEGENFIVLEYIDEKWRIK